MNKNPWREATETPKFNGATFVIEFENGFQCIADHDGRNRFIHKHGNSNGNLVKWMYVPYSDGTTPNNEGLIKIRK